MGEQEKDILLSVKPQYANLLVEGIKTVELRRRFPTNLQEGTRCLIYSTSPIQRVIGECKILTVDHLPLDALWKTTAREAMIPWEDFKKYFTGLEHGYAIRMYGHIRYEKTKLLEKVAGPSILPVHAKSRAVCVGVSVKLSFLLDTNVIIQFEEVGPDRRIKDGFQQLHALLVEHSLPFKYHPLTESDLDNDKDKGRLGEIQSRLKKYPKLDNPPTAEGSELEKLFGGIGKTNDLIDCQLLFALKRNCATYLVSQDEALHRRVANTDLDDRVLFVKDAIDLITRQFKPLSVQLPNVNHEYLYNLDLSLPFFDSLKADYSGFDKWIEKNAERRCWTIRVGQQSSLACVSISMTIKQSTTESACRP